jgi:multidrug efflux pump subunit AcrA (membrane-fusion protein)
LLVTIQSGNLPSQFIRHNPENEAGLRPALRVEDCLITDRVRKIALKRIFEVGCFVLLGLAATGCHQKPAAPAAGMQAMPVQTVAVALAPVAHSSEYVATIKSRRSATLLPQVSGVLTQDSRSLRRSRKSGSVLMDDRSAAANGHRRLARATERQKKALYDYNTVEVERQRKLFEAGVTSRDAYDQARQSYDNTKADYESAVETRKTQEEQLAYYTIRAPFAGVVGDIPVHVGDYASPSLPAQCSPRWMRTRIWKPTSTFPRSAPIRCGWGRMSS